MAVTKTPSKTPSKRNQPTVANSKNCCSFTKLFEHITRQNVSNHLFNSSYSIRIMPVLFILEIIVNIYIVRNVKCKYSF